MAARPQSEPDPEDVPKLEAKLRDVEQALAPGGRGAGAGVEGAAVSAAGAC